MIRIGFEDGSIVVVEQTNEVSAAVQAACLKLSADISSVSYIQFRDTEYSMEEIERVRQLLALQDAIAVLRQYADPANWSGVFNRQKTVQRRWKGEGEGFQLARFALDRLQRYGL